MKLVLKTLDGKVAQRKIKDLCCDGDIGDEGSPGPLWSLSSWMTPSHISQSTNLSARSGLRIP